MKLSRRQFMQFTSLGAAGLAAPRLLLADDEPGRSDDIIISIFLRGAADGLNIIPPWGDADYYRLRPTLAIPRPGEQGGALPLDDLFGLHPGMASLVPLYEAGELAIIHACGSPSPSRSHFEAQDLMERGLTSSTDDYHGWLGRYLDYASPGQTDIFHAVALEPAVPRTLVHEKSTIAIPSIEEFSLLLPGDRQDDIRTLLEDLYAGNNPLDQASRDTLDAVDELTAADPLQYPPENDAQYPDTTFGRQMQAMGQLIKADIGLRAGALSLGGWDTHEGEADTLDTLVPEFSAALAAFHADMGERMNQITLVTQTEFGRRAYENGSGGTDHGHGSFMLALGKNVNGGQVYGRWPGLGDQDLDTNGDLAITTDYRDILAELIAKRTAGMPMDQLFPDRRDVEFQNIFN